MTSTVVDWIDIFTRSKYKHIILESLAYCQQQKGLKIYAWVFVARPEEYLYSSAGDYAGEKGMLEVIVDGESAGLEDCKS